MKSQIQPITFWQDNATQFEIELVQIRSLGEDGSAIIAWNLKDESDRILKNGTVTISGADYSLWGNDDSYIISKSAEILGINLINPANVV